MPIPISTEDAAELFDIPTIVLYVCDGKRDCRNPNCFNMEDHRVCHHTEDETHARYDDHDFESFDQLPTTRNGVAAIIRVEPIRE